MKVLPSIAVLCAACSPAPPPVDRGGDLDVPQEPLSRSAAFELTWNGQRIGGAIEDLSASGDGYRLTRSETVAVRRAATVVESRTEIDIRTDRWLRAWKVDVVSETGATRSRGGAQRADDGGWVVSWDGEPPWRLPARAVPAELVLYQLAAENRKSFSGSVFLPGYGFARAHLRIEPMGDESLRATATTELGAMASTIELAADGGAARVVTGQPLSSRRVPRGWLREPFDPPEIVDSSSIPIAGARAARIAIAGARRAPPEGIPGQQHALCDSEWRVDTAHDAASPDRQTLAALRSLARRTAETLSDGADAPAASAGQALALGRGDCTAHARLFAQLARERGYDVQLVTGFRADHGSMVRHRWAMVRTTTGWVSVDPTWGEAPIAAGRTIALAMHGDSARDVGIADDFAFRGMSEARARYMRDVNGPLCDPSTPRTPRSGR